MTTLIWQTSLILLCAYFLGAWVACILRRALGAEDELSVVESAAAPAMPRSTRTVEPPVRRPDPKPIAIETIQRSAPHATTDAAKKFEDVLTTAPKTAPTPAAPPVTRAAPPVAAPSVTAPVAPPPSAPALNPGSHTPASVSAPATAAAASAAVAAAAAAAEAMKQVAKSPPVNLPAAASGAGPSSVAAPIAIANDDLMRIRSIDADMQSELSKLGVSRYQDIAAWLPADVARISKGLGFAGRIEQENWIEQAQILAKGGETAFARRVDSGQIATAAPTPGEGVAKPIAAAPALSPASPVPAPVSRPNVENLAAFAQPAPGPVVSAPTAMPAAPAAAVPMAVLPRAVANEAAPGMAAASASAAAAGLGAASGMSRDNLQRISGINAEVEKLLNVQGYSRYSQIASWTPADAMRIDRMLGYEGRVSRESWIEQAVLLARGGDTAFSRQFDQRGSAAAASPAVPADAPRPARTADPVRERPSDMSSLRSVRSEAYASAPAKGMADDLKRIRGVGVLIEKKLNSMGINTYAQVANWSSADIDRVSNVLDFRGRIERENWVEQARILSAGGQTEFSRRVDRGEVGH